MSTLSGPKTIRVRGWKSKGIMGRGRVRSEDRSTETAADCTGTLRVPCGATKRSNDLEQARHRSVPAIRLRQLFGEPLGRDLEGPGAEQEIDDVAFVRLQPIELDRGNRADVQAVDVRGVGQRSLEGSDRR